MGAMNNLIIEYAGSQGISVEEVMRSGASLTDMQQVIAARGVSIAQSLPVGLGKAAPVQSPPIPWITIKSYVEVALQTTNLTGYTVAVLDQNGLAVTWEHCLIEVSTLRSSLQRYQAPLFQLKLFETKGAHKRPLTVGFEQGYADIACLCATWFNSLVIHSTINTMETEWAAESATTDQLAEQLAYGQSLAEDAAQLNDEVPDPL